MSATMRWPMAMSLSSTFQRLGQLAKSGHNCLRLGASAAIIELLSIRRRWLTMLLTRLLNACHHFPGFVYDGASLDQATKTIEVQVRPRRGSKPRCSGCSQCAPGYDRLAERGFEFIPMWGFAVLLLYSMRRVHCRACAVMVEEVPWAMGKHTLTRAYMLYLAHWARKLSWQETARSFRTSLEKVCHAVEYVVQWGL